MAVEKLQAGSELLQLVSFFLGEEEYGVDIALVQEIVRMTEITRVPNAPTFVEGVVNLRGRIVPVVDLRKRLSVSVREYDKRTRIVIATITARTVGLIVDGVSEVLRLSSEAIEPPPDMVTSGLKTAFIKGVGKLDGRLLIMLDLDRVLRLEEAGILASI